MMRLANLIAGIAAQAVVGGAAMAATMVFEAAGPDAAAIQATVDDFRAELGARNANAPVNAVGGRREIDWDAAPDAVSDPNPFPGDFFNFSAAPRARGVEFAPTGTTTGFLLSANDTSGGGGGPSVVTGRPPVFGFPGDFAPFSPQRMFTPIGGVTFDVLFFDPVDQTTPAASRGLGVVFSDVEAPNVTKMTFFDANGAELLSRAVLVAGNLGFSFLGVAFDDPIVSRVAITSGFIPLPTSGSSVAGEVVVMDDFIFGEPTPVAPVPLPAAWMLLGGALFGLASWRRLA